MFLSVYECVYEFNIDDGDEWNDAEERAMDARDVNFFLPFNSLFLIKNAFFIIIRVHLDSSISVRRMSVWLHEWTNE